MSSTYKLPGAIYAALRGRSYLIAFLAISATSSAAYSYLLSGSSLNLATPRIMLGMNAYALASALLTGILLSLSIVMNAFAIMNGALSSGKVGLGAVVASVIPTSLCCTSIIPVLLAAFGASTPTIIGVTGALQGPFATYETLFISASIGLLLLSIFLVSRSISKCCIVRK